MSMHVWVGATVELESRKRNPEHEPDGKLGRVSIRSDLVDAADAPLEIDREGMQAEEVASDQTVERLADEVGELVGVESERTGRQLAIPPTPVGSSGGREAHGRAGVEQEAPARIGDEVSVDEFESALCHRIRVLQPVVSSQPASVDGLRLMIAPQSWPQVSQ